MSDPHTTTIWGLYNTNGKLKSIGLTKPQAFDHCRECWHPAWLKEKRYTLRKIKVQI